jgi:hypothetical protein
MLFGGRPLPKRPLIVRLLIVGIVICLAAPIIGFSAAGLLDQFAKMSSDEVEAQLASHPLWGATAGPQRDIRCEDGTRGWDYICTFAYRPQLSPKRMKVGVNVGHRSISYVSPPHELDARYIMR